MSPKFKAQKLKCLAGSSGMTIYDLLEMAASDSTVPGICTNANCNFTRNIEPDQENGYCDECQTNTVSSALALAGII